MHKNHRRKTANDTCRDQAMWGRGVKLSNGKGKSVSIGNDFTNGNRGMARAKAGAKKALRTAERRAGNEIARRDLRESE